MHGGVLILAMVLLAILPWAGKKKASVQYITMGIWAIFENSTF
jgi:hypothetical protein